MPGPPRPGRASALLHLHAGSPRPFRSMPSSRAHVWTSNCEARAVLLRKARSGSWGRFALCGLALGLLGTACRPHSSGPAPRFRGDFRELDRPVVGEALREDWDALERLQEEDPGSPAIQEHADRLLAADQPPVGVQLGAWLAKARQAYFVGEDGPAIAAADRGLAVLGPMRERTPDVAIDLAVVRLRALVRGGDPSVAVETLNDPALRDRAGLHATEWLGLEAVAYERDAQTLPATIALARWRESVQDGSASAAYAELRLRALTPSIPREALHPAIAELPEQSAARQCLERAAGTADGPPRVPWVEACGAGSGALGILLPRSGRFAALADEQLAAVSVSLPILVSSGAPPVVWKDSGSTPDEARAAAQALVAAGVHVIVGPVGTANVQAVEESLGDRVRLVVPGEGRSGVAPSIEARMDALVQQARRRGASRFVVAAPENTYGQRAIAALRARLGARELQALLVQTYSPETTSFAPTIAPLLPALRRGAAVILPDHISRVELLVRQLARSGKAPHPIADDEGALILSTAEGLSEVALGPGHEILAGMWVAPTAIAEGAAAEFAAAYREHQGEPPSDQSLLVFFALRKAITGTGGEGAHVMLIQGGRLVAPEQAPTP